MASAIRRQDWFQVLIEILIVIIGIFLGLQVQAWYGDQQAAKDEMRIIEYFIADLKKNNIALTDRSAFMDNQIRLGHFVIEKLNDDELLDKERQDFQFGIFLAGFTEPLNSFLNSINPENLSKIRDDELRRIIDSFSGYIERSTTVSQNIKTNIHTSMPYINSRSSFVRDLDGTVTSFYDYQDLLNDREYQIVFANVLGKTINYKGQLLIMIEESEKMIEVLEEYQAGKTLPKVEFK